VTLERQSGAESFAEFWARVACVVAMTVECDIEELVAVTHGGFMLAFDWQYFEPYPVVDASLMWSFGLGVRQTPFDNGQRVECSLDVGAQRWHRIGRKNTKQADNAGAASVPSPKACESDAI